jgi:hypothetical protein
MAKLSLLRENCLGVAGDATAEERNIRASTETGELSFDDSVSAATAA